MVNGGGISRPFPFAFAAAGAKGGWEGPPFIDTNGPVLGGVVGKGRVRSRSAREYSCLRKYVCASQNASFGLSIAKQEETSVKAGYDKAGGRERGKQTTILTGPADDLIAPKRGRIVQVLHERIVPPESHTAHDPPFRPIPAIAIAFVVRVVLVLKYVCRIVGERVSATPCSSACPDLLRGSPRLPR